MLHTHLTFPHFTFMFKIINRLSDGAESGYLSISLEVFTPSDPLGVPPLKDRLSRFTRSEPLFVDFLGLGGASNAHAALALARDAARANGLTPCVHLGARDMESVEEVRGLLVEAKGCGVCNLVVEGGSGPHTVFPSAAALVAYIHGAFGGYFCTGVVGYPPCGQGECGSFEGDMAALKECAQCGAEFVLAQHTFEAEPLLRLVAAAGQAGLRLPIIPSILLLQSWGSYQAVAGVTGVRLPAQAEMDLQAVSSGGSPTAFRAMAVELASKLCRDLLASGAVECLHFITLNLEVTLGGVLEELGILKGKEGAGGRRPLPWRPTPVASRVGEDVRPLFWGNRAASYVDRTAGWAQFPSGRWGGGQNGEIHLGNVVSGVSSGGGGGGDGEAAALPPFSPAVGSGACSVSGNNGGGGVVLSSRSGSTSSLDKSLESASSPSTTTPGGGGGGGGRVYGELHPDILLANAGSVEERRAIWGSNPGSERDVWGVFAEYVGGGVPRLPWCTSSTLPETNVISQYLLALNASGFCTINSQPRVCGASSEDRVFGWGGPGGRVYQKAYIEAFCSPGHLSALIEVLAKGGPEKKGYPSITFHAVNASGHWHTNSRVRGRVNAVTWGVFPDREILQPTVMDPLSFVGAWREEAFGLWTSQWASIYTEGEEAHTLLLDMAETYFLVNAVENDYEGGDLFPPFLEALASVNIAKASNTPPKDPKVVMQVLEQQRAAEMAQQRAAQLQKPQ